jgi:hypothetical protein
MPSARIQPLRRAAHRPGATGAHAGRASTGVDVIPDGVRDVPAVAQAMRDVDAVAALPLASPQRATVTSTRRASRSGPLPWVC